MKISCTNWKPAALEIVGYCELKKSHVTLGTCIHGCTEQDGAWRGGLKSALKQPVIPHDLSDKNTHVIPGVGDVLQQVILSLGFNSTKACGCSAMRVQMNQWGLLGCWMHRREILDFLKTKADAVGVPFDESTVWSAVSAALWAWKNKSEKKPS